MRYNISGAKADGDTLRSTVRADLTARLVAMSQSEYGMSFSGPAAGTFQFEQEHVQAGTTPRVTTASGQGAPYVDAHVPDGTNITLRTSTSARASTAPASSWSRRCSSPAPARSRPCRAPCSATRTRSARARCQPAARSGGGPFTAHSPLWALLNPGADLWVPVAADPFNSGFAAEGEAGAASVEWSLAPEG